MSEEVKKEIDLTNYVPKEQFVQAQQQNAEASKNLEALKNQLLDKDYLEFLESKRAPAKGAPAATLQSVDLKNLDMQGLVKLIQEHTLETVTKAVGPQLQKITGAITDVQAVIELDQARQKYEDFDKYSKEISSILEHSQNELTIAQAYLMAKAQAPAENKEEKKTPPKFSERPGSTVPLDGDTIKTFKNSTEAATSAWNTVAAKHGLSGDTI